MQTDKDGGYVFEPKDVIKEVHRETLDKPMYKATSVLNIKMEHVYGQY